MKCRDSLLLESIIGYKATIEQLFFETIDVSKGENKDIKIDYPLDSEVLDKLSHVNEITQDEYFLFNYIDKIKEIWLTLIEKSIKCLRFFDKREPFKENHTKHPIAYGIDDLAKYYKKYSDFEKMLYGGAKFYRDHVIHVFRVWLLGVNCLLDKKAEYLKKLYVDSNFEFNPLEKLSIWTMISLTHDLGYPLEKSQTIIDTTRDMMKCFIANPILSMDLSFNGIQNNMNDFVLRFMSSKMVPHDNNCPKKNSCETASAVSYVARLQPKFYFKFQKSLENYMHGTISALIIYKMLLFFLESDFNINEDYQFEKEDARQFYIRREILRSIASHTCKDIYHLKMETFSFLLIVADDCQEWGRKNISELYTSKNHEYKFGTITTKFDKTPFSCEIDESFTFDPSSINEITRVLKGLKKQFDNYSSIFRDGQDTKNRNFKFEKSCFIIISEQRQVTYKVNFVVSNTNESTFTIDLTSSDVERDLDKYGDEFLIGIFPLFLPYEEIKNEDKEKSRRKVSDKYKKMTDDKIVCYKLNIYDE